MTTNKKASLIGHDPLAWINESSPAEASAEVAKEVVDVVESSVEVVEKLVEPVQESEVNSAIVEEEVVSETVGDVLDAVVGEPVSGVVKLEGDLTIQGVQALHDLLSSALEQTGEIQLDAEEVRRVDT
ncbi:MAG: STAS domain-containing protein, partial [Ghiorsea sp.]